MAWLSYAVDYLLWGMKPVGFHLTSLLLHSANAALFFLVCRKLYKKSMPQTSGALEIAALFAALFFALHPLRVEPLAWASARRDLLAGLFFLAALLSYLSPRQESSHSFHANPWTFLFYGLSLLAKPSGIGLPFILLILDVYLLQRGFDWKEKIPYLAMIPAMAGLAWWGQASHGSMAASTSFDWTHRLAQAGYAHSFYLLKTLIPMGLSPMYERLLRFNPYDTRFLLSAAATVLISASSFALRRRWPALWMAWLSYVMLLVPVMGFIKFGTQLVADRYSYLPAMSAACLVGAVLLQFLKRADTNSRLAVFSGTFFLLAALGTLSWKQTGFWKDSETLYRRILSLDPDQAVARNNLGLVLDAQGKLWEAVEQYNQALRVRPHYASASNNLGAALIKLRRLEDAEIYFRAALKDDPGLINAYNNLALVLAQNRRYGEALSLFDQALLIAPQNTQLLRNQALVLHLRSLK